MKLPTGRQIAAARVLAGLQQRELAREAKIDPSTLNRMEGSGDSTVSGLARNVESVVKALERRGVEITEDSIRQVGKPKRR